MYGNLIFLIDNSESNCIKLNQYMMTSSNGNIFRVTGPLCGEFTGPGEFPTQRPVTRSFDVFFDLRLNKRLSEQPWGWWFETPSWSLWRQCNDHVTHVYKVEAWDWAYEYVSVIYVVKWNNVRYQICICMFFVCLFCFHFVFIFNTREKRTNTISCSNTYLMKTHVSVVEVIIFSKYEKNNMTYNQHECSLIKVDIFSYFVYHDKVTSSVEHNDTYASIRFFYRPAFFRNSQSQHSPWWKQIKNKIFAIKKIFVVNRYLWI